MQPPPLRRRSSNKGLWIALLLLAFVLIGSLLMNFGLLMRSAAKAGAASFQFTRALSDEYPDFTEIHSYGDGDVKVVRIGVQGIILRQAEGGLFAPAFDKIEEILQQIRAARNDEEVRALIVEVDSPGGGITPSDEIYQALRQFKESDPGRKVVVHMRDLAASGGYYVAMAGDILVAEPTSIVGSIGVIMQALNWKALSEKIGLSATTIKSGANKDLLNPFEDVSPEQVALLQESIDAMYRRFFDIVKNGRGISAEDLKPLADGRIFTADAAFKHNLIDRIGYWEDAVEQAKKLLAVDDLYVVRYERKPDLWNWLYRMQNPLSLRALAEPQPPRMLYLWTP